MPRSTGSLALFGLLLLAACPEDYPSPSDAAPADSGVVVNEAGLAVCDEPGAFCVPADPCGLNPRCSRAGVCEVTGRRDCDDGIACTDDSCIHGGCLHEVQPDHCLIAGACHHAGVREECGRCDPQKSTTRWTPLDGLSCDDRNPCTKGDECTKGVCVGRLYSCTDGLVCTFDSCDGVGGCEHFIEPGFCAVERRCYADQQIDESGCNICDTSVASDELQPRTNVCTIDGQCYSAGTLDHTGCRSCAPLHDPNGWTLIPKRCLIGSSCVIAGGLHPSKCARCAPSLSTDQWVPVAEAKVELESFDEPLVDYHLSSPVGGVGWKPSAKRYNSAPTSLYYGNPKTLSYDNGAANSGTATSPSYDLPSGQRSFLSFWLWIDTESTDGFDVLTVEAGSKVLWTKSTATITAAQYRSWQEVLVELHGLAGETVAFTFHFETVDAADNTGEGVYIDDVMLLTSCGDL